MFSAPYTEVQNVLFLLGEDFKMNKIQYNCSKYDMYLSALD